MFRLKSKLFTQLENAIVKEFVGLPFKFRGLEINSGEFEPPEIILREGKKIAIYHQREKKILNILYQILYEPVDKKMISYCIGGRRGFGIGKFYDYLQQAKANKLYWIVKTDVKDYFSSIDLDLLSNILKSKFKIPRDVRKILFILLTLGIGEMEPKGILIGNPLGKLLGNVYLSLLDDFLLNKSMFFVRFIDDVCIFCKNKKSAEKIFLELKEFLNSKLNLAVAENKTGIYHLYFNRFKFLGFEVVGNSFSSSQENVKRFKERIICLPREYKNKGLKKFIKRTNSLVYNFGHLYKRGNVCKLFKQLDEVVRNRVREYFKLSSNGAFFLSNRAKFRIYCSGYAN